MRFQLTKKGNTMNSISKINLINAKTFGEKLSLSKRQIFRLNSYAKIPTSIKINGAVRWNESEISAWILSGCPDRKTWEQMKEAEQC